MIRGGTIPCIDLVSCPVAVLEEADSPETATTAEIELAGRRRVNGAQVGRQPSGKVVTYHCLPLGNIAGGARLERNVFRRRTLECV